MCSKKTQKMIIFTIGHSTRTIADFITILQEFNIQKVVDVRTIPRSRHNPQFNEEHLKNTLHKHTIGYTHVAALGGLRHTHKDSINTAWKNASFRGYADYMQTDAFKDAIQELITMAHQKTVVIMCAEAVPWRCHRSLIGDALLARGVEVEDIFSLTSVKPHTLTPWAVVHGANITYPAK